MQTIPEDMDLFASDFFEDFFEQAKKFEVVIDDINDLAKPIHSGWIFSQKYCEKNLKKILFIFYQAWASSLAIFRTKGNVSVYTQKIHYNFTLRVFSESSKLIFFFECRSSSTEVFCKTEDFHFTKENISIKIMKWKIHLFSLTYLCQTYNQQG